MFSDEEARRGAEALAAKMIVSGPGLYMLDKEDFTEAVGPEGGVIYRILQDGQYGYVSL